MKKCKKCNLTFEGLLFFCEVCGGRLQDEESENIQESIHEEIVTEKPPYEISFRRGDYRPGSLQDILVRYTIEVDGIQSEKIAIDQIYTVTTKKNNIAVRIIAPKAKIHKSISFNLKLNRDIKIIYSAVHKRVFGTNVDVKAEGGSISDIIEF